MLHVFPSRTQGHSAFRLKVRHHHAVKAIWFVSGKETLLPQEIITSSASFLLLLLLLWGADHRIERCTRVKSISQAAVFCVMAVGLPLPLSAAFSMSLNSMMESFEESYSPDRPYSQGAVSGIETIVCQKHWSFNVKCFSSNAICAKGYRQSFFFFPRRITLHCLGIDNLLSFLTLIFVDLPYSRKCWTRAIEPSLECIWLVCGHWLVLLLEDTAWKHISGYTGECLAFSLHLSVSLFGLI